MTEARGPAPEATLDGFAGHVANYAADVSVKPPVIRVQACRSIAYVGRQRDGSAVLTIDPQLLLAPVSIQRATAAHEVGHLALGHVPTRAGLVVNYMLGALLLVGALVAAAWPVVRHGLAGVQSSEVVMAAVLTANGAALASILARSRARELAADRWAAHHGAGLTADCVRWYAEHFPRTAPRGRLRERFSSHPSWSIRLAMVPDEGPRQNMAQEPQDSTQRPTVA